MIDRGNNGHSNIYIVINFKIVGSIVKSNIQSKIVNRDPAWHHDQNWTTSPDDGPPTHAALCRIYVYKYSLFVAPVSKNPRIQKFRNKNKQTP